MKTVVALCAKKGTGKSTLAKYISSNNRNAEIDSFATTIKLAAKPIVKSAIEYEVALKAKGGFPGIKEVTDELIDNFVYGEFKEYPLKALGGKTSRHIQQVIGTEAIRGLHNSFFAKTTAARVMRSLNSLVIIDDMREPIEFDSLAALEPLGIKFVPVYLTRVAVSSNDTHSSETNVDLVASKIPKENHIELEENNLYQNYRKVKKLWM